MKSKAHFKKCSELGLNPIPTMPEDDANDLDDSNSDKNMGRRSNYNSRENDGSRCDSETEDVDSDDDDDESGDGRKILLL